jgi:uncharacterized protein (DUF488 family)
MAAREVFTIGHSVRPLEQFLAMLRAHEVGAICDVRRFPSSRRHPHFGQEALRASLSAVDIAYHWLPELGGRRETKHLSAINDGWRVKAFHAYADYFAHPDFSAGLERLEEVAERVRTAFMCAEALWTKCHRRLIADVMVARGWTVRHIIDGRRVEQHALTEFAVMRDGAVTYPKA